jgi:diguanylate cyclase (GGDEF)-like protein
MIEKTRSKATATRGGQKLGEVRLSIADEALGDLVEIALRLEGLPVQGEEDDSFPALLVADPHGVALLGERQTGRPQELTLLLVADETDIPSGSEYLVVPHHGADYELDPDILVRKVRSMLSGKKPSAERNPVTGLPGAAAFEAELSARIGSGERFGVLFADLAHFKSYNKAYSYARGDRMLVTLGELMQSVMGRHQHPQNYLAHLGSDDFALITSEKQAPFIAEEIVDAFDDMAASFYDVADLARGCIVLTDRRGNETPCPLVTIAIAVILSSRRPLGHPAEALDIAEELLDYLKSRDIQESCCIVERRSGK